MGCVLGCSAAECGRGDVGGSPGRARLLLNDLPATDTPELQKTYTDNARSVFYCFAGTSKGVSPSVGLPGSAYKDIISANYAIYALTVTCISAGLYSD